MNKEKEKMDKEKRNFWLKDTSASPPLFII